MRATSLRSGSCKGFGRPDVPPMMMPTSKKYKETNLRRRIN